MKWYTGTVGIKMKKCFEKKSWKNFIRIGTETKFRDPNPQYPKQSLSCKFWVSQKILINTAVPVPVPKLMLKFFHLSILFSMILNLKED